MVKPAEARRELADRHRRIAMTHRCHEKQREIESARLNRLRLAVVLLSALEATGVVAAIVTTQRAYLICAAVLAFISLSASLCLYVYKPEEREAEHHDAAADYLALRNRASRATSAPDAELVSELRAIDDEVARLARARRTPGAKAYRTARKDATRK